MGTWLKHNGKGIYGTRCSERPNEQQNGTAVFYTRKEDSLYVFADLKSGRPGNIYIKGGKTVTVLDERVKFTYTQEAEGIRIQVTENASGFDMVGFEVTTGSR